MKEIWLTIIFCIEFILASCASKKEFYSKATFLDTANPDTYIILVEQEGKDLKDARERALKNAIDKASYTILKTNYEKMIYENQKDKIYIIKNDIITGENELEKGNSRIKISFAISKSKLKANLIKNEIARKSISYKNSRFTPFILVKNTSENCQPELTDFMKVAIKGMITRIGAKLIENQSRNEETEESLPETIDPSIKECISYECDFTIEINSNCSKGFYAKFKFYDPILSNSIEENSVKIEFSEKVTSFDILDEGIYRIFLNLNEKYAKYMDSATGTSKIIYIEGEKNIKDIIEDKLAQKLPENQIYIVKKIPKEKGLLILVITKMSTEEIGFIIPYILSNDIKLQPVSQNRKFISFFASD